MLQLIMTCVYLGLISVIFLMFVCCVGRQHYLMWHVFPGLGYAGFVEMSADVLVASMQQHYIDLQAIPVRDARVMQMFGDDIGKIILEYLPRFGAKQQCVMDVN